MNNPRYSVEADSGCFISYSDYSFNEEGLNQAIEKAKSFIASKFETIKVYASPEDKVIFEILCK